MRARLVRIGNSRGVRLPKPLIDEVGLGEIVQLQVRGRTIVIAPERTELVRYKIARSPLLRQAIEAGNWHILKSNHLHQFAYRDEVSLGDLEPYLGLDPAADRGAEQIPLFG